MKDSVVLSNFITNNTDHSYRFNKVYEEVGEEYIDAILTARNLFDLREYKKCAHLLKEYSNDP